MQTVWYQRHRSLLALLLWALAATAMVAIGTAVAPVMLLRDDDGLPPSDGVVAGVGPSPTAAPTADTPTATPSAVVIVPATPEPSPTVRPTEVVAASPSPTSTTAAAFPEPASPTRPSSVTPPAAATPQQVRFVMYREVDGVIEGRAQGDPGSPTLARWNSASELRELFGEAATPLADLWPEWLWIPGPPRCGGS